MTPRTFHIMTFGCQMNVGDSAWLARSLESRGFAPAPLESAGVIVLNTCSVRDKAERKVYSALGRIRQASRFTPGAFAVVAGCVAQQLGGDFLVRFPQVRLVVGGDGLRLAPESIERLCEEPDTRIVRTEFIEDYPEREPVWPDREEGPVAFVNIMQGCDNFCAYCIVPYTRGRQKSRAVAAILDECRAVLDRGAKDVTLLGQNVNAFGLDSHGEGVGFAELLEQVARLPGLERLRFVTPHPADFSPETVAAFASIPQLCPRLHLPLQAGSDRVLRRMRRRYDRAAYLRLVENLRHARPDLALSSDIIVGFPGESEEDFRQTLEMLDEADFMASFSFCYSDRPGTPASRFSDKIDPAEQAERLARFQARQDVLAARWLESREGRECSVLLESRSRKSAQWTQAACPAEEASGAAAAAGAASKVESLESWSGRDPWGDVVNVLLPPGTGRPGLLLPVRLTHARRHSLLAEAVDRGDPSSPSVPYPGDPA